MRDHSTADDEQRLPLDLPPEIPEADAIDQRSPRPGDRDDQMLAHIVHDAEDRPVDLDEGDQHHA